MRPPTSLMRSIAGRGCEMRDARCGIAENGRKDQDRVVDILTHYGVRPPASISETKVRDQRFATANPSIGGSEVGGQPSETAALAKLEVGIKNREPQPCYT
jgi:hypothetical protein